MKALASAWRDPVALLAVPAVLYLLLFYGLPLGWLLAKSFAGPAGLTLQPYAEFFADPFNWRVIGNTLSVALWVTLVCLLLGYPAAFALARAGVADISVATATASAERPKIVIIRMIVLRVRSMRPN